MIWLVFDLFAFVGCLQVACVVGGLMVSLLLVLWVSGLGLV